MANKKISSMTELATTPASGDKVPLVDVSDTTGAETGTTKWVSVDNLVSEIAVADMAASAVVTESEGIGSSDNDTSLPTSAAVKDYVDTNVTAQDLDFQGDSGGALAIDLDSESLTIAGGTGISTVGSSNTVTASIDSTVATLTGSQTLTNKTLTDGVANTQTALDNSTKLATTAYTDSAVAGLGGDITSVTAGTNLGGGGASGDVTVNLETTLTALTSVTSTDFVGTLTGNVTGNVTGDVTGDLTGDSAGTHTGAVTGNVTGDVTGGLTGDSAGTHTGAVTGNVTGNVTGDLTGNVTATSVLADGVSGTTQSASNNSTKVATTAYVDARTHLELGTSSSTALAGDTTTISAGQASAIAANTAKATNATHTGEVTGDAALTVADDTIDEANLKADNSPTNDYVLTAKSSATGGLTWAEASSGDVVKVGTPVDNQVGVWTGDGTIEGTSSLVFDSTGLGIGAEIPLARIDVLGSGPYLGMFRNTQGGIRLQTDSSLNHIVSRGAADSGYRNLEIRAATSGSGMVLTTTGSLGIGGTPAAPLHVFSTGIQPATFESTSGSNRSRIELLPASGGNAFLIAEGGYLSIGGASSLSTGNLNIDVVGGGAGNVGIGVVAPTHRLHNAGTSRFDERVTVKKSSNSEVDTLTSTSNSTAVDMDDANNFSLALGENTTLAQPTNITAGQSGAIVITQDGTGGRTMAYNAYWKFEGGTDPVLSTGALEVDTLVYYVASTDSIHAVLLKDMS